MEIGSRRRSHRDVTFDRVWRRIEAQTGETLRQIRGREFTYEVRSGAVWPGRTRRALPRSHFERAFATVNLRDERSPQ